MAQRRESKAFRRAPHLVGYWLGEEFVLHEFLRQQALAADPMVCDLLHFFGRWRTLTQLYAARPRFSRASLRQCVSELVKRGLLVRRGSARPDGAARVWDAWNPAAGFFHFSTKDVAFAEDAKESRLAFRRLARAEPMPPPVKRYPRARRFPLPAPLEHGDFARVLLERRTWRRFGKDGIELAALSTLLSLTSGVRWWVELPGAGRVAFKTSPSGGARHPLECYVVARRVRGLPAGIYHYAADVHRLELVRRGLSAPRLAAWLPGQSQYADAAALCVFTAVFRRVQWKYRFARAYRTVLLDAGHVGQTFCLVATSLGLAPFCTAALADSRIERDLGVDGVGESVIYVAGVGTRPHGMEWAPLPTGKLRRKKNPLARPGNED